METMTAFAVLGALACLEATAVRADPITIDQALARASQRPSVQVATLDLDAARARARGAVAPRYNPEVSASGGPQFGAGWGIQLGVSVAQTLERGGKREARGALAEAEVHGAEALRGVEQLDARVEAWRAFEHALVARARLATRGEVEQLVTDLAAAMHRTAQAGGTTKLRANVIEADAGRARQDRIAAEIEYASAVARLGAAIGADPRITLEPAGTLGAPRVLTEAIEPMVARALRAHPVIMASAGELDAARARIADADARGVADLTLGIAYAYAPDPEGAHAVVASVAFPLAIRYQNQGERAAARIEGKRAELEAARVRAELERRVRLAYASYQHARDAVAGFGPEVTERLHENLTAAQEAFTRGGLDFVELTATQRDLVAARVALLDARLAAIDAWAELVLATGMEVLP